MDNKFYSVDQVSEMLSLHPKTTRRYIREGKLRANKVGKQYRITGHDLSSFVEGHDMNIGEVDEQSVFHTKTDKITVSAVVDILVEDEYEADRISGMALAVTHSKDPAYGKSTINVQQYAGDNKLRIMLWGSVHFAETMLGCLSAFDKQ